MSYLNLPAFPTTNLLYASQNKLAEVVLRYSIPLLECKPYLEQKVFDQVDILHNQEDCGKRIFVARQFRLALLHPQFPIIG